MMLAISTATDYHAHIPIRNTERETISSNSVFAEYPDDIPATVHLPWTQVLHGRLGELEMLEPGWDGYLGVPLSSDCANFERIVLAKLCRDDVPAPDLVPGSDGTVQIEWHINQYDVEIDIRDVYNALAVRVDKLNDEIEEIEVQSDFSEIAEWIRELSVPRC